MVQWWLFPVLFIVSYLVSCVVFYVIERYM